MNLTNCRSKAVFLAHGWESMVGKPQLGMQNIFDSHSVKFIDVKLADTKGKLFYEKKKF